MSTDQAVEKARAFVDEMLPIAKQIVATGQEHMPTLIVHLKNGKREVIGMPGLSKDHIARLFRSVASQHWVEAAALVMEAWLAKGQNTDTGMHRMAKAVEDGALAVKDILGSTECILYNVIVGERQFLCACDINRADNSLTKGELIDLSQKREGERFEGRMVGTAAQRAAKRGH